MHNRHPAFVLGMFETGLAVGRSLARNGVSVLGIDFKKDIGFYSRYLHCTRCPHPLDEGEDFIKFLVSTASKQEYKPVLFVTSDDFLRSVADHRATIERHFLLNLPNSETIFSVSNKYLQYKMAMNVGIPCPATHVIKDRNDFAKSKAALEYPAFVKAQDVNAWRKHVSSSTKGYVVNDERELVTKCQPFVDKGIELVVQEVVLGPDSNHFKICCYVSRNGTFLLVFTLQKLRQLPVRFGVGSAVMSIHYPDLIEIGAKFFKNIAYRGVGSAEFKLDEKDGKLKLIELNPRYWQQNALAEKCGMNFPMIDYMESTGQNPHPICRFRQGVKWVNLYMDIASFWEYWKRKQITIGEWLRSLKDMKVLSDFAVDDPLPVFYESKFGMKILKIPSYLLNKCKNGRN